MTRMINRALVFTWGFIFIKSTKTLNFFKWGFGFCCVNLDLFKEGIELYDLG